MKKTNLIVLLMLSLAAWGLFPVLAMGQQRISGKVTDPAGAPVVGAAVMVQGTTNGAVTENDGSYVLGSVPSNGVLEVSCLGYRTENVAVGGRTVINVVLNENSEMVEETVVIGYAVQRKSDVTGAVSSIKSDELENRMTENLGQALMGKAAGVQIMGASGAPGETMNIRGEDTRPIRPDRATPFTSLTA